MQAQRTPILIGVLVILVLAYVSKPLWETHFEDVAATAQLRASPQGLPAPLPGTNSIANIQTHKDEQGRWLVTFDYFYTGAPLNAVLRVDLTNGPDPQNQKVLLASNFLMVNRGAHRVTQILQRPVSETPVTSNGVLVRLSQTGVPIKDIVTERISFDIVWPDSLTANLDQEITTTSIEAFLVKTVELIDTDDEYRLELAKQRLNHLLLKDSRLHSAYLELARVAMKSNWGPEGLRQAEGYINSAKDISPDDPNVWILQGYVYAYQGRYKEAEPLFVAASKTDTPNLWLWTNWGELFNLQGKTTQAIQMFQKAIDQPPPGNTYDWARRHAYWQLLGIFKKQKKSDQVEALYKQRFQDYGSVACYGVEYARFLLMERGNAAAAIELANQPALAQCSDPDTKEVLGVAHYVAWAVAPAAERPELLNRARVYFPPGTRLIYWLATSDRSVGALKELLAAGESIDQIDNRKMTALAYALSNKDHDTTVRLLKLHGRPDFQVGDAGLPVALIPVMGEDYLGIRLMRQFGINYANIKYQNSMAFDHAKQTGNRKLLEALGTPAIEQRL